MLEQGILYTVTMLFAPRLKKACEAHNQMAAVSSGSPFQGPHLAQLSRIQSCQQVSSLALTQHSSNRLQLRLTVLFPSRSVADTRLGKYSL